MSGHNCPNGSNGNNYAWLRRIANFTQCQLSVPMRFACENYKPALVYKLQLVKQYKLNLVKSLNRGVGVYPELRLRLIPPRTHSRARQEVT